MLAMNLVGIDDSGSKLHVYATLTASGNYVSGGDELNFAAIAGAGVLNRVFQAGKGPIFAICTGSDGYLAQFIQDPAPSVNDGFGLTGTKLKFFDSDGTELSAGAYPAGILADTNIFLHAVFDKDL